jgi:hypothetical protein
VEVKWQASEDVHILPILSPHSQNGKILFGKYVGARFRLLQYQFVAIYGFGKAFGNSIEVSLNTCHFHKAIVLQ